MLTEIKSNCRTFQFCEGEFCPELIHIIKTGFEDLYIIVYEDAYEQFNLGKNNYYTAVQIMEKFNIDILKIKEM
jgi:hypothetical protein